MALGPLGWAGTWYLLECDSGALWTCGLALGTKGSAAAFLRGLRMGLAFPNSACVGGFSCGSSLLFCGVAVGEFDDILALILTSGCRCDDGAAPAEVSAGLRSETMAEGVCCRSSVRARHACFSSRSSPA